MYQLKFNSHFNGTIRDISYWKITEDIPKYILNSLKEKYAKIVYHDSNANVYRCGKCLQELKYQNYCKNCNTSYQESIANNNYQELKNISENKNWHLYHTSYVFDVVDNDVILYILSITVYCIYDKYQRTTLTKTEITPDEALLIDKEGFLDLNKEQYHSLEDFNKYVYHHEYSKNHTDLNALSYYYGDLYLDNLFSLKDTIYRYTFLWEAKNFFEHNRVTITEIVFLPLYFPAFEYLIKNKLFNLALNSPEIFHRKKLFSETFNIDKKYIPFISRYDLTWEEVEILKSYPTKDIELIRFFKDLPYFNYEYLELIKQYKINLKEQKTYLASLESENHIIEYFDYLFMAHEIGINLKNKKILYPKNLLEAHNKLFSELKIKNDPNIGKRIEAYSSLLSINNYEDENYIIYPAHSIEDLVKESYEQNNCVRSYSEKYANNDCQIYFMRKKTSINKSFVTIEIKDNFIVQARTKNNNDPSDEIKKILNKWEKNLIPIINQS